MDAMHNREGYFVPANGGDSWWVVGDLVTFKVGPEQTGGKYSFAETTVGPGGGPPPHLHGREDELFYVLEGTFEFTLGDTVYPGPQGSTVFLPRGTPHWFKNVGDANGRLLIAAMPCGFEAFIPAAGVPCTDIAATPPPMTQPDIDRLLTACAKFGMEMRFDHRAILNASLPTVDNALRVLGVHVNLKMTSADTAGQFSAAELTIDPGGGIPPHAHLREDEIFYVLEGSCEATAGGQTLVAGPSDFLQVPSGVMHAIRNSGTTRAKLIDFHTPGGFERFFEEAGTPRDGRPSSQAFEPARIAALCRKHGMVLPE